MRVKKKIMKDTILLFDLDGTLWDSSESVAKSWTEILATKDGDYPEVTGGLIRSVMGRTMVEIAEATLPDVPKKEREDLFRECLEYENEYIRVHGGVLMEGVRETLEELVRRGYRLGIVSNCQTGYIDAFLESMKMRDLFFATMEWGETELPKGENIKILMKRYNCVFDRALATPETPSAVYVGDTQSDCTAADVAGIPFIHAAYGFGVPAHADATLTKIADLLTLFP